MKIQRVKKEMDTVVFIYPDGTKQSQIINKESFFDNKGKRKSRYEMMQMFQETALDRGAISFSIDSENVSEEPINTKKSEFTFKERKFAKKDYKDFKKSNPEEFIKFQEKFRKEFLDKLMSTKRLKFNLKSLFLDGDKDGLTIYTKV